MPKQALQRSTLALCLAALPAVAQEAKAPEPPLTVLRAARLFSGTGDVTVPDAVVIVRGKTIEAVGSRLAIPAGASVIDLGDATLLPGLMDAHIHVTGESGDDWYRGAVEGLRRTVAETTLHAAEYARRTLMAGFTTARNLGADEFIDVGLRNAINAGMATGPRLLVSTNALGARGGHCDLTGFPYLLFGKEPGFPDGIASGPDGFRDAVRFQVKYGADVIKTCATGGVLSLGDDVDTPQLTQAELDAIVDETHRLRKRAAAHAHGAEGAKAAIRAGVDSIEHGSFLDDEALRMMKQQGTALVPTLMAGEYAGGRKATRRYPPEIQAKADAALRARSTAMRKAVAGGVTIAFGTDSAVSPHGRNAEEFALMVEHGMSPAAALRSATSVNARLFGVEKTLGTLEAGKLADVVAVPGDVLADVRATERVFFVMKEGTVYRSSPR
jgi:imidazolonepropionase-like amidohydrolase